MNDISPRSPDRAPTDFDVVVVGGGNAGFSAAHAAALRGRSVVVLEKGTRNQGGGNSYYTAGATRISHDGLDDIRDFIEVDARHEYSVVPPYPAAEYESDMARVTEGKNDPELTRVLVEESQPAVRWLSGLGIRYRLMYERQAYERADGSYLFWGGLHIGNVGGGVGLIHDHEAVAERLGVVVRYGHVAVDLLTDEGRVAGVVVETADGERGDIRAESVILAAGGFEANAALRREYLGEEWDKAKVRGTPNNDGVLLKAALAHGAIPGGDWTTCHSVQWDAFSDQNESNRELTNRLTRGGYPLGVILNAHGERFLDEGADFRNYTYAKYGREILKQPGSVAYQVFDSVQRALLRSEEYDMPGASVVVADTIDTLGERLEIDAARMARTISEYNDSIDRSIVWDLTIKDGKRANTSPVKSNWAEPIENGPFYAFPVTCGITFTFGGLKADTYGRVLTAEGAPIEGLYVCGEMLGGLFSENYPGGTGLAAGMVFGKRAGTLA